MRRNPLNYFDQNCARYIYNKTTRALTTVVFIFIVFTLLCFVGIFKFGDYFLQETVIFILHHHNNNKLLKMLKTSEQIQKKYVILFIPLSPLMCIGTDHYCVSFFISFWWFNSTGCTKVSVSWDCPLKDRIKG